MSFMVLNQSLQNSNFDIFNYKGFLSLTLNYSLMSLQ